MQNKIARSKKQKAKRRRFEFKNKAIRRGVRIARYAPSHAGCPNVEKILIIGWKSAVQQETSKLPLKIRQVGSYPKWLGNPHRATIAPDTRLIIKSFFVRLTASVFKSKLLTNA